MKRREGKIPIPLLISITLVTILLMFFELNSKHRVKAEFFEEKIAAAELTQRCFDEIKQASDNMNIPIDRINDPNETGLIGIQYSPIITERGDLNAKLTSTNPNLAALIVKLIKKTRIEKGNKVAVSLTGSLPGLNIAVLSTLEILELRPIIITAAIQRNHIDFLAVENLDDAIRKRMDIYRSFGDIKLFINIGERTTSWIGVDPGYDLIQSGQVKQGKGLIAQFLRAGVPVINLDHISQLAEKYGLPNAPIPLPDIGKGRLYYEYKYSVTQAVISLVILVLIIFVVLRFDIEDYFRKDKK